MSTRFSRLPLRSAWTGDSDTVTATLTAGAAVALGLRLCTSLVVNVPAAPSRGPVALLGTLATVLAAAGLVAGGVDAATPTAGAGLLFAGVFGLLAAFVPAATVPAAVAVGGGTALVAAVHRDAFTPLGGVVVALLVVALASSLVVGVAGIAPARPFTSTLSLVALAATPAFVATNRWSLVRAAVAVAAVVGFGLALPFVTGAITLVSVGAVGVALPVVALAVAGVVTTGSAAVRERRWLVLAAVALLAFAGVPATLGRAVPFALGIATLVREVAR